VKRIHILCILFFVGSVVSIQAQELRVGKTAPDFTFTTAEGKSRTLSSYRGKPVALHFWATWCGPCIRELPLIASLSTAKAQDLTVLAVNCAEPDQTVSSFLAKRQLKLNVIMDRDYAISRLYAIDAIPQTYMIDAEGIIRSIQVGAYTQRGLNRDVSALLGG
jgi:peroxiredoxin